MRVDNGHGWQSGTLQRRFDVRRADTLILLPCYSCRVERYPASSLNAVQIGTGIRRSTHIAEGALVGVLVGVPIGVHFNRSFLYEGGNAGLGGFVVGSIGGLAGALVGASLPTSFRWITLDLGGGVSHVGLW
ncbi:MAG: hypothetical protein ACR2GG_07655 [Gemmatimonadaceae bacterium]